MAIIGTILGDIVGSQYEHRRPKNLDYKHCCLFIDHCRFTDDTVMTLVAKKSIINNIPFADSYRDLGRQYPYVEYITKREGVFITLQLYKLEYPETVIMKN